MIPRIRIDIELLEDVGNGNPKRIILSERIERSTSALDLEDQEANSLRLCEQVIYSLFRRLEIVNIYNAPQREI